MMRMTKERPDVSEGRYANGLSKRNPVNVVLNFESATSLAVVHKFKASILKYNRLFSRLEQSENGQPVKSA